MAQRHQAATVVVAGEVQHDRAQVRRSAIDRVDPAGMPREAQERLLHDVLGGISIVDEETRQSHQ